MCCEIDGVKKSWKDLGKDIELDFIIYVTKIPMSTSNFPTQKYKILYHATRVFRFRITILAYADVQLL